MSDSIAAWLADHDIREVRIEGTNLEGSFIGKFVSPAKFLSGLTTGFAFADVAFGLDMSNNPQFGFAMPDWRGDLLDIYLHVDTDTLIEWSPRRASVIGDFRKPDGEPISACPRAALRRMTQDLSGLGYEVKCAVEIEASLFEESIHEARSKGYRNLTPLGGSAGSCYHLAKSADWSEYMRAVIDRLVEVGIPWEAYNDEAAAGQIEFNISPSDPVSTADHWARTRQIMRETAFAMGRTVTFMAKYSNEYGQASHLNVSLERDGHNAFYAEDGPSPVMDEFIGGVMATLIPATSFALPMITSYRRLVDLDGPPTTATWGIANKSAAVRAVVGHPKQARIEYRTPGSDSNVYLVLAVILAGGIAGLKNKIAAPAPFQDMAWCLPEGVQRLPDTLSKAVAALKEDTLLGDILGQDLIDYWVGTREWEWLQFHTGGGEPDVGITQWESNRYFELP